MRKEFKYEITYEDYIKLIELLDKVLKRDRYSNKNGEYSIRSIYFDILQDEKDNRKITKRYRIRMYNKNEENIFLEKKSSGKGFVEKNKSKISKKDVENILSRKLQYIDRKKRKFKNRFLFEFNFE